jgi:hypothetical protein
LSDQDLLRIDRRRDSNRFGFALHLCATEWEHITLTGSYYWRQYKSDINILRPLRIFKLSKNRLRQRRALYRTPPGPDPSDPCFGARTRLELLSVYFCLFRLSCPTPRSSISEEWVRLNT